MREAYADWPIGELDEFHSFREKEFKYIYYCPHCFRSFETIAPTNKCKFCSGNIKRLAPIPITEDYTVEHDMKRRAKTVLFKTIKKFLRPKRVATGNQKTLNEKYPMSREKINSRTLKSFSMPKLQIFSRNKEELPTR